MIVRRFLSEIVTIFFWGFLSLFFVVLGNFLQEIFVDKGFSRVIVLGFGV